MDSNMMNPFSKPSLHEQELAHALNEYRKLGSLEHLKKLVEQEKICSQIQPESKTIVICTKDGQHKTAVLPAYLQTNYAIGHWLLDHIPEFDHWCYAAANTTPDIRYDLEEFIQENDVNSDQNETDILQTAVVDTIQSRIFLIRTLRGEKCRICCNYYLIGKNTILGPPIYTEDFADIKSAWATLLEIKRRPHMTFMSMSAKPAYQMFNMTTDIRQLMIPATDHVKYLESQIADIKPALDAYKRTGWEPHDYKYLTCLKDENAKLQDENKQLITRLADAMKKIDALTAEKADLLVMMNHM